MSSHRIPEQDADVESELMQTQGSIGAQFEPLGMNNQNFNRMAPIFEPRKSSSHGRHGAPGGAGMQSELKASMDKG